MTASQRRLTAAGTIAAATMGATAGIGPNWLANLAEGAPRAVLAGLIAWVALTATAIALKAAR